MAIDPLRSPDEISEDFQKKCINTIRFLAVDGVQQANSGHPGMPMEAADLAYLLWSRVMKYNPANPDWANRDRFVLSAGHGSMLLYAMLHLTGYDLSMQQLSRFRQWESQTPGHPECRCAPGVETTTGPLGQGFATGVGMAMAEAYLARMFDKPDAMLIDYFTYGLVSDGDIMEGVSSEAASLAGHLGLSKLIYIYLDNRITIEGKTDLTFSEDVKKRFESYNWHIQKVDGYDLEGAYSALMNAQAETSRPSLIIARTHIAYGSPNKQDTADAHGAPLGPDEVAATKENCGWPQEPAFYVPEDVLDFFRKARDRGGELESHWQALYQGYRDAYPDLVERWEAMHKAPEPATWQDSLPRFSPDQGNLATRKASGQILAAVALHLPGLIGGSADLAPSNNTYLKGFGEFRQERGPNIHFGIREHAMGAILNGLALNRALIPYGGTFLVFSDYMRPAIRLASLMGLGVIYVFTHDSIGLGEDGPTHQPIEHLAALRAIPGLTVIRPADALETVEAWQVALQRREGPTALILSRQGLPVIDRNRYAPARGLHRGAYILAGTAEEKPEIILMGTGSEVQLLLKVYEALKEKAVTSRVVSMPSWELFDAQSVAYQCEVLPPEVPIRLAVEAGATLGWERYTGSFGSVLGIDRFGASAPANVVLREFGFAPEAVMAKAQSLIRPSQLPPLERLT